MTDRCGHTLNLAIHALVEHHPQPARLLRRGHRIGCTGQSGGTGKDLDVGGSGFPQGNLDPLPKLTKCLNVRSTEDENEEGPAGESTDDAEKEEAAGESTEDEKKEEAGDESTEDEKKEDPAGESDGKGDEK